MLNTLLEQTFKVEVIFSFAFSLYQVGIAYILDQVYFKIVFGTNKSVTLVELCVKSGIRTHAYDSRLRPERSALDHSAILT